MKVLRLIEILKASFEPTSLTRKVIQESKKRSYAECSIDLHQYRTSNAEICGGPQ